MIVDYSQFGTTAAEPDPSSMIETFRAIGYSIEAAVADIIDNSISAGAKNVWLNFEWLGETTWFAIRDDGNGMNNEELIQALKPGSKNPLENRNVSDLGRFGLGLKTASFSQCRMLTVVSRKKHFAPVFWTWDLDYVKNERKWNLLKFLPNEKFLDLQRKTDSGTIVVWHKLDRLVGDLQRDDQKALDKFLLIMESVKRHLAMVFHKYLENGRIKIHFQDRIVNGWNPFMTDELATQRFPEEPLQNGKVRMKGYVLPHKSKLSEERFRTGEGSKGWNGQQGFYVYRNDRLLLDGDWLGMFKKEEHYKLARIEINLPNNLDADWQIDIKKSIARPPLFIREQLKAYANIVRAQAVEVYKHRGKNIKPYLGHQFVPLWVDHKRGDKWFYKVNRAHPVIDLIKEQALKHPEGAIEALLKIVEESIPVKSIYIREAEEPEAQGKPFEGTDQELIKRTMKQMFENLTKQGKAPDNAKAIMMNIEPFNQFPEFLEYLN
jgi:hypothetical protein